MKDPYAYAPEAGEAGQGTVKLADEDAVYHTFTPAEARAFAATMLAAADAAEQK